MAKNGETLRVSKEWFIDHYVNQTLSTVECARLLSCHPNTVRRWLKRYGIETRVNLNGVLNPMFGKTGKLHHNYNSIEKRCPVCGKLFTVPMYDVGKRQTCSWECRNQWWKDTGKQAGDNNPHWCGGFDYRRGFGWREVKRFVRKRDGYQCTKCGITEQELGRRLDVHHKTPYKNFENDHLANHPDNLVSLCKSCHMSEDRKQRKAEQ